MDCDRYTKDYYAIIFKKEKKSDFYELIWSTSTLVFVSFRKEHRKDNQG